MLFIHLVEDFEVASKVCPDPRDLKWPFWVPGAVSALQGQLTGPGWTYFLPGVPELTLSRRGCSETLIKLEGKKKYWKTFFKCFFSGRNTQNITVMYCKPSTTLEGQPL